MNQRGTFELHFDRVVKAERIAASVFAVLYRDLLPVGGHRSLERIEGCQTIRLKLSLAASRQTPPKGTDATPEIGAVLKRLPNRLPLGDSVGPSMTRGHRRSRILGARVRGSWGRTPESNGEVSALMSRDGVYNFEFHDTLGITCSCRKSASAKRWIAGSRRDSPDRSPRHV